MNNRFDTRIRVGYKNDEEDVKPVDLSKSFLPRFSSQRALIEGVYGKDFISDIISPALEKPEARDLLVQESLKQIKETLVEINTLITSESRISLQKLVDDNKKLFDKVCAALEVIGIFIHQNVKYGEISGVRFDTDTRRFVLGLGSGSGGERILISRSRKTDIYESVLSFPGQDTTNCRVLQSGFRKLFPGRVKRNTFDGPVVEDLNNTKEGDLFLEF